MSIFELFFDSVCHKISNNQHVRTLLVLGHATRWGDGAILAYLAYLKLYWSGEKWSNGRNIKFSDSQINWIAQLTLTPPPPTTIYSKHFQGKIKRAISKFILTLTLKAFSLVYELDRTTLRESLKVLMFVKLLELFFSAFLVLKHDLFSPQDFSKALEADFFCWTWTCKVQIIRRLNTWVPNVSVNQRYIKEQVQ